MGRISEEKFFEILLEMLGDGYRIWGREIDDKEFRIRAYIGNTPPPYAFLQLDGQPRKYKLDDCLDSRITLADIKAHQEEFEQACFDFVTQTAARVKAGESIDEHNRIKARRFTRHLRTRQYPNFAFEEGYWVVMKLH